VIVKQGSRQAPLTEERKQKIKQHFKKIRAKAIEAQRAAVTGKRGKNARLSEQTITDIFFSPESLNKTAMKYGVSKKMVLLVKQRKTHTYLTKDL
jgi:hypothetical protein